jgi:hypothetical protein
MMNPRVLPVTPMARVWSPWFRKDSLVSSRAVFAPLASVETSLEHLVRAVTTSWTLALWLSAAYECAPRLMLTAKARDNRHPTARPGHAPLVASWRLGTTALAGRVPDL